jgi:precorrin-2 dehydrogenase/sirohydrochlorin ferrochelatase
MTTAPPPTDPPAGYPVVLTVSGRRCLVVGGGPVAARRARGLLEAGATVTVVAPDVVPAIERLADGGTLEVARRPYRSGEAARYHLVLTATGVPEVDRSVVADAESAGVLVNTASGDAPGTVQLPAVHREGPVTVAVSTAGTSPALSRWLADRVAASLPANVVTIAELLDEARSTLMAAGRATGSVDWQAVLTESVVPLVEAGRIDEARAVLRAV